MARALHIRDVPTEVCDWIENERRKLMLTQKEFLVSLLTSARKEDRAPSLFDAIPTPPAPTPQRVPFSFVDLFAGIGGFRIALGRAGGRCVFSSEWDKHAQKTYNAWFGEVPFGDIRTLRPQEIPDHDLLAAGFPCQPCRRFQEEKSWSSARVQGRDTRHPLLPPCNLDRSKAPPCSTLGKCQESPVAQLGQDVGSDPIYADR